MKLLLQTILRWQAKLILWKYRPVVVAVTGSVGKSSAKEAIYSVLSSKFSVRRSMGNYNTEIGVPLAIIGARHWFAGLAKGKWQFVMPLRYPKVLVLELAADRPGDIAYLADMVGPDISVVTAVGPSHLEFFDSREKIAEEKANIILALTGSGVAVLNYDDEVVRAMAEKNKGKTIYYGTADGADVQAVNIVSSPDGLVFKIQYKGSTVPVQLIGVLGAPSVYAALSAAAVGLSRGMNLIEIATALRNYRGLPGRLQLLQGIKHTRIIDDTYNAAPASAIAALAVLSEVPGKRKIAVLGDMAELGAYTEDGHRQVGAATVDHGINFLVTVGPRAKFIADQARQNGLPENQILSFADAGEARKPVEKLLQPEDTILVKGSQLMRMERITKEIMAEPERAPQLLCRQSREWLRTL